MALLTAEERKKLSTGANAKYKCDKCKRPILSTLIYATKDGQVTCSSSCRDSLNSLIEDNLIGETMKFASKKSKKNDEDEDTKKKKKSADDDEEDDDETEEEEEEEEEGDDEEEDDDEDDEKPVKKVKKVKEKKEKASKKAKKSKKSDDDDEEEDEPKKKKGNKKSKKSDDDDDDEKPKRKTTTGTDKNPFREGSSIATAFDKVRAGISVKDFKKFCTKEGHDFGWYMARFRKEEKRGLKWSFSEDDDDLKLTLKKKK